MILGVPTLNRYDLLSRLIASAERGRCKPGAYFIVDNGGKFEEHASTMPGVAAALARDVPVDVLSPGRNLGVAASWNAMLDRAGTDPLAIANDDVELGEDALLALTRALGAHDFVIAEGPPGANGWCLFAQTPRCTAIVGPYDENFFPAYYEDSDYDQRLSRAGIAVHREPASLRHEGWATMQVDPTIRSGQQQSAEYFRKKWGAMPYEPEKLFREPFNGDPAPSLRQPSPAGEWKRYMQDNHVSAAMRWDIINHVVQTIGARSYLEIGVSDGTNLRHLSDALEKWGVDPQPQIEGVKACTTFVPSTSDGFFERNNRRFDVVFVDGLHYANQACRDILNAARVARVVIAHDASPFTEAMQIVPPIQGEWTGDVWKAIARIRAEGTHLVRTVDTDYGVAVILPNRGTGDEVRDLPHEAWIDLQQHRQTLLGLVQASEWKDWFDVAWSA